METDIKVKRTGKGKFGFYILDESDKFHSCTEAVSNYILKYVPCEIRVKEMTGKEISKVDLTVSADQKQAQAQAVIETISKDVLIVRQSCLKAAIEAWEILKDEAIEQKPKITLIEEIAEEFENWVWRN